MLKLGSRTQFAYLNKQDGPEVDMDDTKEFQNLLGAMNKMASLLRRGSTSSGLQQASCTSAT